MSNHPEIATKFGHVAVVGRPNVGKSTLINRIIGQKVSITASKPQTTRHRITGIYSEARGQIVFVDTPGLHEGGKTALNRQLNRTARAALADVDLILFVISVGKFTAEDQAVLELVAQAEAPVVLLVNKTDLVNDKKQMLPFLAEVGQKHDFAEIYPISARRKRTLESLLTLLFEHLPAGEPVFSEDEITTVPMRFMAAEIIRERLARALHDELPYQITVDVERYEQNERGIRIGATIYVARKGQKGIVIGKGGQQLKQVGQQAREALQRITDTPVHLDLWVKVHEGWADDERSVAALGYQLPE